MIQISPHQSLRQAREEFERRYLEYHLQSNGGRIGRVAKVAKINRCHLYRIANRLGLSFTRVVSDQHAVIYPQKRECAALKEAPQPWPTDR